MTQQILLAVSEELLKAVSNYYESGEYVKPFRSKDLADCVVQHSAAVGIAAMGVGVLPGAGQSFQSVWQQLLFGGCTLKYARSSGFLSERTS